MIRNKSGNKFKGVDIEVTLITGGDYILKLDASKYKIQNIVEDEKTRENLKKIDNAISLRILTYLSNVEPDRILGEFGLCGVRYELNTFFTTDMTPEEYDKYKDIDTKDLPDNMLDAIDILIRYKDRESAFEARRILKNKMV